MATGVGNDGRLGGLHAVLAEQVTLYADGLKHLNKRRIVRFATDGEQSCHIPERCEIVDNVAAATTVADAQ